MPTSYLPALNKNLHACFFSWGLQAARALLMGRMLRRQRSVLSAWASWPAASSPFLTAAAMSSASDASLRGQR